MEIFEILKANCKFIKLFKLNKIYSLFIKLCILILFIFSSNRNLFSRGYDGKYEKILLVLNRIFKGNNFILPGTLNTFEDCIRRYYKPDGTLREEGKRLGKKVIQQSNTKMILFSKINTEYYKRRGYKKFKLIGYPIFYKEFKSYILKNSSLNFIKKHKVKPFRKSNTISIHVNKYFGKWAGKNDDWLKDRFEKIIKICEEKFKNVRFLVRVHPAISEMYDDKYKKILELSNSKIKITTLHPSTMASLSFLTIGITTSSTFLHSMSMNTPYIEYAELTNEQLKIFPEGSMHVTYGVVPAKSTSDLKKKLNLIFRKKNFLLFSKLEENHKTL